MNGLSFSTQSTTVAFESSRMVSSFLKPGLLALHHLGCLMENLEPVPLLLVARQ